jgi:hypothetical protein
MGLDVVFHVIEPPFLFFLSVADCVAFQVGSRFFASTSPLAAALKSFQCSRMRSTMALSGSTSHVHLFSRL